MSNEGVIVIIITALSFWCLSVALGSAVTVFVGNQSLNGFPLALPLAPGPGFLFRKLMWAFYHPQGPPSPLGNWRHEPLEGGEAPLTSSVG